MASPSPIRHLLAKPSWPVGSRTVSPFLPVQMGMHTDKHGPFGTPNYNSITPAEYFAALAEVGGQQDMGDDPITCPKCGRRTDFGYATFPVSQHHRCPASENECGHEFVVSLEDAPADG